MNTKNRSKLGLLCAMSLSVLLLGMPAKASMPVIDIGAIIQLIQQVTTMADQLSTAKNTLTQAQSALRSMTGARGMENLLNDTVRNYLPVNWDELEAAINDVSSAYHELSSGVQELMRANSILTPEQLAWLSPAQRAQVEQARRTAAVLQATAREALEATSERFDSIQRLIDAIPSAGDQKGILDLQARIAAEQGMLANEQTKLQVLYQAAQADELARQQRVREQIMQDVGSLRSLPAMGL